MTYQSNMTSKGQVTVPADIRRALGLRPGEPVGFTLGPDGEARLFKPDLEARQQARRAEFHMRIKEAQAIFKANDAFPGMSTDEFMAMIREPFHEFEERGSS